MSNKLLEYLSGENLELCEWCGNDNQLYIYSITVGVIDEIGKRADSIVLCCNCLQTIQNSQIEAEELFIRVAIREKVKLEDIFNVLNLPTPITIKKLVEEKEYLANKVLNTATYIEFLLDLNHREKELRFIRGDIIKRLVDEMGMELSAIADEIGHDKDFVVNHLNLRRFFPEAESKDNNLLAEHYMVASASCDPHNWLMEALEKNLKVGELRKIIEDSVC